MPAAPLAPATSLKVIRAAMLFGVVAFGAIAWQVSHARPPGELKPLGPELVWVGVGLLAFALVGGWVVRGRITPRTPPAQQLTLSIICMVMAEAAALYGAVVLLLTGAPLLYVVGLLLLLGVSLNLGIRG